MTKSNNCIFIDTSILCADYWMKGQKFMLAQKAGFKIVLCDAVIAEAKRRFQEDLSEAAKKAEKSIKDLSKFFSHERTLNVKLDIGGEAQAYSDFLDRVKKTSSIEVGFPSVSHSTIFKRMLAAERPFSENGHKGYADYIIWQSYLEFISSGSSNGSIIFLSFNTKDFFASDNKNVLHLDLKKELRSAVIYLMKHNKCGTYLFYSDFEKLITERIRPHQIRIEQEEIKDKLRNDDLFVGTISDFVDKEISACSLDEMDIRYYGENGKLGEIDYIELLEIDDISKIDDENYVVEMEFEAMAAIESTINKVEVNEWPDRERRRLKKYIAGTQKDKYLIQDEVSIRATVRVTFKLVETEIVIGSKEIINIDDGSCGWYGCPDGYWDDEDEDSEE